MKTTIDFNGIPDGTSINTLSFEGVQITGKARLRYDKTPEEIFIEDQPLTVQNGELWAWFDSAKQVEPFETVYDPETDTVFLVGYAHYFSEATLTFTDPAASVTFDAWTHPVAVVRPEYVDLTTGTRTSGEWVSFGADSPPITFTAGPGVGIHSVWAANNAMGASSASFALDNIAFTTDRAAVPDVGSSVVLLGLAIGAMLATFKRRSLP